MELRHLKFFLAVANEGNITKASEIVHTSQPNLSRQMQELESLLECKLFVRGKTITLTQKGILLKRRAEEILRLASKTKEELSESLSEVAGTVAIGFGEMRPVFDIARLATLFKKQNPKVHFDFFTGTADQVKEQMEKGLLDAGLLMEPVEIGKYEFFRLSKKVQIVAVMKRTSVLASKKYVTPADLAPLPLIFPVRQSVRNELFSWFGEYASNLDIVATGNLATNNAILVHNGLGIAIGTEGVSAPLGLEKSITYRPLSPAISLSVVLAWKKGVLSPVAHSFLHFAKTNLNSLPVITHKK